MYTEGRLALKTVCKWPFFRRDQGNCNLAAFSKIMWDTVYNALLFQTDGEVTYFKSHRSEVVDIRKHLNTHNLC